MMPKMNLNGHVWVKLNDKGRRMHRDYWEPFSGGKYQPPEVSIDGYSRFQLHELMRIFGPGCSVGCDIPMESEIILDCDRPIIIKQEGAI